jgi:hypothetical protein
VAKSKQRGERRDRTWRYGRWAQRVHLRFVHPHGPVDCLCEQSVWFFRKRKAIGCRCRAKLRGAPKLPGSRCADVRGGYRATVRERIRGRRLTYQWLVRLGGCDPDDIEL